MCWQWCWRFQCSPGLQISSSPSDEEASRFLIQQPPQQLSVFLDTILNVDFLFLGDRNQSSIWSAHTTVHSSSVFKAVYFLTCIFKLTLPSKLWLRAHVFPVSKCINVDVNPNLLWMFWQIFARIHSFCHLLKRINYAHLHPSNSRLDVTAMVYWV